MRAERDGGRVLTGFAVLGSLVVTLAAMAALSGFGPGFLPNFALNSACDMLGGLTVLFLIEPLLAPSAEYAPERAAETEDAPGQVVAIEIRVDGDGPPTRLVLTVRVAAAPEPTRRHTPAHPQEHGGRTRGARTPGALPEKRRGRRKSGRPDTRGTHP